MADQRLELFQNIVESILASPGDTPTSLRTILTQQPAQFYGLPAQPDGSLPAELKTYVTKTATQAYKVTDQDVEQLSMHGYSEDAIFEITLSVAVGAGILCLEQGMAALKGADHASEED